MVAHTFEWVVDKEATELENGAKHEECIWCHYAKDVVEIPMLGGTSIASPKTGDTGSWICVAACMVFAAGVGMVVYKRKEN